MRERDMNRNRGGARGLGRLAAVVMLVAAVSGCDQIDLGGGGGGGGGSFRFEKGFVFVRDLQIVASNASDGYTSVGALTNEGSNRTPVISPDGRLVAFIRVVGNATELRTVPTTGGASSLVLSSANTTRSDLRLPAFTRDSQAIAYAFNEGGRSSIGLINTDGSNDTVLNAPSDLRSYTSPSFAGDGTLLVAGGPAISQIEGLYTLDLLTGAATSVVTFAPGQVLTNRAVIAPDGRRAAFDARTSNTPSRIYVATLSTGATTQLTDTADADDVWPTWVGSTSVGFSSASGGSDQVYVLDAELERTSGGLTVPSAFQPSYGPN